MREDCAEARTRATPSINVTPLIDILLVMLIIFMVITPLRPARFKTLTPQPPPEESYIHMSTRTLVVSVEDTGSLKLIRGATTVAEGTVAEPGEVASRLAREWRERIDAGNWKEGFDLRTDLAPDNRIERTVFVRAPVSLRYGEVARVIDAVKGAGADPVGLQTDELPN